MSSQAVGREACCLVIVDSGEVHMTNKTGPRTEHWGILNNVYLGQMRC